MTLRTHFQVNFINIKHSTKIPPPNNSTNIVSHITTTTQILYQKNMSIEVGPTTINFPFPNIDFKKLVHSNSTIHYFICQNKGTKCHAFNSSQHPTLSLPWANHIPHTLVQKQDNIYYIHIYKVMHMSFLSFLSIILKYLGANREPTAPQLSLQACLPPSSSTACRGLVGLFFELFEISCRDNPVKLHCLHTEGCYDFLHAFVTYKMDTLSIFTT